jgi:hypothetical protein
LWCRTLNGRKEENLTCRAHVRALQLTRDITGLKVWLSNEKEL